MKIKPKKAQSLRQPLSTGEGNTYCLPTLYKRDIKGRIRFMTIEVSEGRHRALTGVVGGKVLEGVWTACTPKNVGRANETSAKDQAELEAAALHTKAIERRGYARSVADVDNEREVPGVMLAHTFDWKKLKPDLPFEEGVFVQPKLNGCRAAKQDDQMFSRYGKKFFTLPHIVEQWNRFAPPEIAAVYEPDGEAYNHDMREDLNDLNSLLRKQTPTASQLEAAAKIVQLHVYDLRPKKGMKGAGQKKRRWLLRQLRELQHDSEIHRRASTSLRFVSSKKVDNHDELFAEYKRALSMGYEGLMIRIGDHEYEEGQRSHYLLKMKPRFNGSGFTIIEAKEGKGKNKGVLSRLLVEAKRDIAIEDMWVVPKGTVFHANMKGPIPKRRKMFEERAALVGKEITISCAYVTNMGVPFHAYTEEIHKSGKRDT